MSLKGVQDRIGRLEQGGEGCTECGHVVGSLVEFTIEPYPGAYDGRAERCEACGHPLRFTIELNGERVPVPAGTIEQIEQLYGVRG